MKCSGVRHLLSAYLDEELDQGEGLMVQQHLRRCQACADELNALRQTIVLCASLEEVEVPADFRAGLRARLVALGPPVAAATMPQRAPSKPAWRLNAGRWVLPAAAAAAFVVALGVRPFMEQQIAPPSPAPVQGPTASGATGGTGSVGVEPPVTQSPPTVADATGKEPVGSAPSTDTEAPQVGQQVTPPASPRGEAPPQTATHMPAVDPLPGRAGVASLQTPANAEAGGVAPQYALSTAVQLAVQDGAAALVEIAALAEASGGVAVMDGSQFDEQTRTWSGVMVSLPAANLGGFLGALPSVGALSGGEIDRYDYGLEIEQKLATIAQKRRDLEGVDELDERSQGFLQSLSEEIAKLEEDLQLIVQRVETATVAVTLAE